MSYQGGGRPAYAGRGGSFAATRTGGYRTGASMSMSVGAGGVRGYTANAWRGSHPNWSGGYFYHNGGYFYDAGFSSPAIVTNEWLGIAALGGGIAFSASLNADPYLVFGGAYGSQFAVSDYQADLGVSGELGVRARFFQRPYFWRNGVRYNRMTVVQNGRQYYQFHRG